MTEQERIDQGLEYISRPLKTKAELRGRFLSHVSSLVDYWNKVPHKTSLEKLEGLAFSIFVAIDGEAIALPAFKLIADPHPDDVDKYYKKSITGPEDQALHEEFVQKTRKKA